jgi:hypothetical protein
LNAVDTETETLVNLAIHHVLGPTVSATEGRTPLKEGEYENYLGCMTMHREREGWVATVISPFSDWQKKPIIQGADALTASPKYAI